MAMKPPPYARRRKRFGWDKHGIIIAGAVYPNALDVSAGWTGPVGNVTDPAASGVAPIDPTPATYTMIYTANGSTAPIEFGFPVLTRDPDTKYNIAIAAATVIDGVVADTPGGVTGIVEIYSGSAPRRPHFSRYIDIPGVGVNGAEYEVQDGDLFNLPVDLTNVSIRFTPPGEMAGKGYGLAITYLHLRGVSL